MIISGYGFGFNIISQGDVTQNDISQLQSSIQQDKSLEELGFGENFKVESTGNLLNQNFSQVLSKFDFGISSLTNKISSLKSKLASLLKKKKKPWGLIKSIKNQIKMFTKGLKNLKKLKSKFLNLRGKTTNEVNRNLSAFNSSMEAKDALYNRGARLLSQFPNLQGDFRFLLTVFNISIPENQILNNPFLNTILGNNFSFSLGNFEGIGSLNSFGLHGIMQNHDVNQLANMLNLSFNRHNLLLNRLNALNQAENLEFQKLMKLQMDINRFTQASSFAKMRKVFFKGKEVLFKGFSKALDVASKVLDKMSIALDRAADGLEAAANAAQAIPLVGPAVAAALRMAAKALRIAAKALKKASQVLSQKSKLMQNKANHMKKMQNLMDKKINYLENLKNKTNQFIQKVRNNLSNIRNQKQETMNQLEFNQQLMMLIIMRLRMLGENPMLGGLGMGMPGGIPLLPGFPMGPMSLPLGNPSFEGVMPQRGIQNPFSVGMLGNAFPGMVFPGNTGPNLMGPSMIPNFMVSSGLSMMSAGIALSMINPAMGLSLALTGGILALSGSLMNSRNNILSGMGLRGGFGFPIGGPLNTAVNSIFKPTNVKQQAERSLTEFANQILNNQNNPQVAYQKMMLKQIYLQIAQRIDLSPSVRQLVSRAVGEDLTGITPANSGMIKGMIGGTMMGATLGMLIGGPSGALIGAIAGAASGGIIGGATGFILGKINSSISINSFNLIANYAGGVLVA